MFLTASGDVLTCGDNAAGQLGYPKTAPPPGRMTYFDRAPQTVLALQDLEVIKVTCGDLYCIASCKGESCDSYMIAMLGAFYYTETTYF